MKVISSFPTPNVDGPTPAAINSNLFTFSKSTSAGRGNISFTTTMELEKVPFSSPASVSLCMASFFRGYMSYAPNSFSFEWLERTPDLEVKCKDFTGQKVVFPTSPELLEAIRDCERINHPNKGGWLPNDWQFSGFLESAAYQALKKVPSTKSAE